MAERVSTRLTAGEGRRFAVTLSIAFAAMGALAWWRDHMAVACALGGVAGLCAVAALAFPSRLSGVYRLWMGLAQRISRVTAPIFLSVVYFLVITPIGVVMRTTGYNPLRRRLRDGSYWIVRSGEADRRGSMKNQF